MIKLSIIVSVFNGEDCISNLMESIVRQKLDESQVEVLVVNDASTDATAEIVERYCDYCPFVKLISHKTNRQLLEGRRTGVEAAAGEYILFVDADDAIGDGFGAYLENIDASYDIIQLPVRAVSSAGATSERIEEVQRWLAPKCSHLHGEEVVHGLFSKGVLRWSMWGKIISADLAKRAYELIPSQRLYFAEDIRAMFVIAHLASNLVFDAAAPQYHYSIDTGGSHSNDNAIEKIIAFSADGWHVWKGVSEFAKDYELEEAYAEDLDFICDNIRNNITDRIFTMVSDCDRAQALDAVLDYWDPALIAIHLARSWWAQSWEFFEQTSTARCLGKGKFAVRDDEENIALVKGRGSIDIVKGDHSDKVCLSDAANNVGDCYYQRALDINRVVETHGITTVVFLSWRIPTLEWDVFLLKTLGVSPVIIIEGKDNWMLEPTGAHYRLVEASFISPCVICDVSQFKGREIGMISELCNQLSAGFYRLDADGSIRKHDFEGMTDSELEKAAHESDSEKHPMLTEGLNNVDPNKANDLNTERKPFFIRLVRRIKDIIR